MFGSVVETGYGHIFFHLTHLFVDLHFYVDVRVLGILSQVGADAQLEVAMRAAGGNADGPVNVAEARRPVSALEEIECWESRESQQVLPKKPINANAKLNEHRRSCS